VLARRVFRLLGQSPAHRTPMQPLHRVPWTARRYPRNPCASGNRLTGIRPCLGNNGSIRQGGPNRSTRDGCSIPGGGSGLATDRIRHHLALVGVGSHRARCGRIRVPSPRLRNPRQRQEVITVWQKWSIEEVDDDTQEPSLACAIGLGAATVARITPGQASAAGSPDVADMPAMPSQLACCSES
jgi:hypothetical protein